MSNRSQDSRGFNFCCAISIRIENRTYAMNLWTDQIVAMHGMRKGTLNIDRTLAGGERSLPRFPFCNGGPGRHGTDVRQR